MCELFASGRRGMVIAVEHLKLEGCCSSTSVVLQVFDSADTARTLLITINDVVVTQLPLVDELSGCLFPCVSYGHVRVNALPGIQFVVD